METSQKIKKKKKLERDPRESTEEEKEPTENYCQLLFLCTGVIYYVEQSGLSLDSAMATEAMCMYHARQSTPYQRADSRTKSEKEPTARTVQLQPAGQT